MQVASDVTTASVATLGAKESMSFGMVEDASFLMMLSANLYSNQHLACIREPLCNAWDAHIEAGKTDVPIRVTISDTYELSIEDSGLGIPHDKIESVYGTYGKSTKKNNNAVTGGFGLGSKSPFAYAESFRVISENQGKKVIYNMSRASVEADGKPGITPILTMPTNRSGLTVKFQLHFKDVSEMVAYIKAIAMHGDMNVELEYQGITAKLPKLNLDSTPGSYKTDENFWWNPYMGNHAVFVRYGAVVYPALMTPATSEAVKLLQEFINMLSFKRMIIQAAPGTLALTPSREALSSQKMTEDGITDLCVDLVKRIEMDIIAQVPASIHRAVKEMESGRHHEGSYAHRVNGMELVHPKEVYNYLRSPLGRVLRGKALELFKKADACGFKKLHSFNNKAANKLYYKSRLHIMRGDRRSIYNNHSFDQLIKRFMAKPIGRVLSNNRDLLSKHNLAWSGSILDEKSKYPGGVFATVNPGYRGYTHDMLKQLIDNPTVVITTRKGDLKWSIRSCPTINNQDAVWVYKIPVHGVDKDAIVKAFQDGGFAVVDLTLNHDWDMAYAETLQRRLLKKSEKASASEVAVPATYKKRKSLLISLSSVYKPDGEYKIKPLNVGFIKTFDKEGLVDKPLFYVELKQLSQASLGSYTKFLDLTDEEKKLGVVVRSTVEEKMAVKRGAVPVNSYFAKKFWEFIQSNDYKNYMTKFRRVGLITDHDINQHDLDNLEVLDIKVPGLAKFIHDPRMEWFYARVACLNRFKFLEDIGTGEEAAVFAKLQEIQEYEVPESDLTKKLAALRHDPVIGRYSRIYVSELLQTHPGHKAGLKSLYLSALKNWKKNEK